MLLYGGLQNQSAYEVVASVLISREMTKSIYSEGDQYT
jgi:hypothetical protein